MTDQPSDEAQQRQADRLAVLQPRAVTGPALFDACLELVSGMIAHSTAQGGQTLDEALDGVLADIQAADPVEVATVYTGLVISTLEALQLVTDTAPAELWRYRVQHATRRNEGGRHA